MREWSTEWAELQLYMKKMKIAHVRAIRCVDAKRAKNGFFFFLIFFFFFFFAPVAIADLQRAIRRQGKELYDVHRVLGKWRVFEDHLM
jgi:hypothetical protein